MFIPLHDGKPIRHISLQWVTLVIIGINLLVFAAFNLGIFSSDLNGAFLSYGHIPAVFWDERVLPDTHVIVPDGAYILTTLTSAFFHVDIWHLGGNMLFIWVFGDNVEDALGHFRFIVFYLACAFAAAFFHALSFSESTAPLVGASGAAAGIVAAYLLLHPKVSVWVLFIGRIPLRLPAWVLLGGWIAFQAFMFVTDTDGQVSWASHVGGALAGLVLVVLLKRRAVPLFDKQVVLPTSVDITAEAELPPDVKIPQDKTENSSPWGRQRSKT